MKCRGVRLSAAIPEAVLFHHHISVLHLRRDDLKNVCQESASSEIVASNKAQTATMAFSKERAVAFSQAKWLFVVTKEV